MSRIEPSGHYCPNVIARVYLEALEEVVGRNGLQAILNPAGLSHTIDNCPSRNMARRFGSSACSSLNGALEELDGQRRGGGVERQADLASSTRGLQVRGPLSGVGDLAFKSLRLGAKLRAELRRWQESLARPVIRCAPSRTVATIVSRLCSRARSAGATKPVTRFASHDEDCWKKGCIGSAAGGDSGSRRPSVWLRAAPYAVMPVTGHRLSR